MRAGAAYVGSRPPLALFRREQGQRRQLHRGPHCACGVAPQLPVFHGNLGSPHPDGKSTCVPLNYSPAASPLSTDPERELTTPGGLCYNPFRVGQWRRGSASPWHGEGRGFNSRLLHQSDNPNIEVPGCRPGPAPWWDGLGPSCFVCDPGARFEGLRLADCRAWGDSQHRNLARGPRLHRPRVLSVLCGRLTAGPSDAGRIG